MADNREHVWLECTECGSKNYRTERPMKPKQKGAGHEPANQVNNRLEMNKFCRKERKHTLHRESRKK